MLICSSYVVGKHNYPNLSNSDQFSIVDFFKYKDNLHFEKKGITMNPHILMY